MCFENHKPAEIPIQIVMEDVVPQVDIQPVIEPVKELKAEKETVAGKLKTALNKALRLGRMREAAMKILEGDPQAMAGVKSKSDVGQAFGLKVLNLAKKFFVPNVSDDMYKVIKVKFVLKNPNTGKGYRPDGDSVRAVAYNPDEMKDPRLFNYKQVAVSLAEGNFQLRFEEVDATELHYREQAQPLGAWARDWLLKMIGFTNVTYGPDGESVDTCDQLEIDGYILFKGYDVYGRPICYVFIGDLPEGIKSGTWVNLTTALLKQSLNYVMLRKGIAYLTIYSSSPEEHRQALISAARAAEKEKLGVWALDQTNEFTFTGLGSIGPDSNVVILPKIFRRLVDWVLDGGMQTKDFPAWLEWTETTKKNRNDVVIINGTDRKKLSEVITQKGNVITVSFSLFDCVFEEQEPVKPSGGDDGGGGGGEHPIAKQASAENVVSISSENDDSASSGNVVSMFPNTARRHKKSA